MHKSPHVFNFEEAGLSKLLVFSVRDQKAEAYLRPFMTETKGLAVRTFSDSVNDPQSPMHKHADDYTLFHVGEFDQITGELRPVVPVSLGNALTFKEVAS